MKFLSNSTLVLALAVAATGVLAGCDDSPTESRDLRSASFSQAFNEGQALGAVETAYRGEHPRNLSAEVIIEERADGQANVTVRLGNTVSGVTYPTHVHDFADPATTPNNTPYNETPNGNIFAGGIQGTGGVASATVETSLPYEEVRAHGAFFVVHDPLQALSTTDLTTYLVLGVFGEDLAPGELSLRSETFAYAFNEGQLLDNPGTAYIGEHARNLMAELQLEERADGGANVTVTLMNTLQGEAYPVHAHDFADPATTPSGTPYNETPNGDVFAGAIMGTGGAASLTVQSTMPYLELVEDYGAFLVVHDPTQGLSTTDLTTYLILGIFAEDLAEAGSFRH